MSILSDNFKVKYNGEVKSVKVYSTALEAGDTYLECKINGQTGYISLGEDINEAATELNVDSPNYTEDYRVLQENRITYNPGYLYFEVHDPFDANKILTKSMLTMNDNESVLAGFGFQHQGESSINNYNFINADNRLLEQAIGTSAPTDYGYYGQFLNIGSELFPEMLYQSTLNSSFMPCINDQYESDGSRFIYPVYDIGLETCLSDLSLETTSSRLVMNFTCLATVSDNSTYSDNVFLTDTENQNHQYNVYKQDYTDGQSRFVEFTNFQCYFNKTLDNQDLTVDNIESLEVILYVPMTSNTVSGLSSTLLQLSDVKAYLGLYSNTQSLTSATVTNLTPYKTYNDDYIGSVELDNSNITLETSNTNKVTVNKNSAVTSESVPAGYLPIRLVISKNKLSNNQWQSLINIYNTTSLEDEIKVCHFKIYCRLVVEATNSALGSDYSTLQLFDTRIFGTDTEESILKLKVYNDTEESFNANVIIYHYTIGSNYQTYETYTASISSNDIVSYTLDELKTMFTSPITQYDKFIAVTDGTNYDLAYSTEVLLGATHRAGCMCLRLVPSADSQDAPLIISIEPEDTESSQVV